MAEDTTTTTTTTAAPDKAASGTQTTTTQATQTVATQTDKGAAAPDKTTATTTATTVVDSKTDDIAVKQVTAKWPEKWLDLVAKGDEKRTTSLKKFQSPEALADAYLNLERRMSSGEMKAVLPKDAKPEEIAAWRKDHGIPEKPEGYDLKGLPIPKGDEAFIASLLKAAHDQHMTPQQARTAIAAVYQQQNQKLEARRAKDEEQRVAALDALNSEWGAQFRRNVNIIEGTVLSKMPESVRALVKSARLPDGTLLFNNVDAVKGFATLALELNPAGILTPGAGGDIGKGALEEYREIRQSMRENRTAYNRDNAKQERLRQLISYLSQNGMIDGQGNEVAASHRKAA